MRIFLPTGRRNHLMFVTPGTEHPETSDFFEASGEVKKFTVRFVDGMADVPSPLGKFLIGRGLAQRTALIRPEIAAQVLQHETRIRTHRVLNGIT